MGINKFIYNGETKFDLSSDTVTAEDILLNKTTHDSNGDLITGTYNPFMFSGTNAELVDTHEDSYTLDDTSFVIGQTAPTASTVIKASVSKTHITPTLTINDKDIIVIQQLCTTPTFSDSATGKAQQIRTGYLHIAIYSRRYASSTATSKTTRHAQSMGVYLTDYYNTSGTKARAASTSYGMYGTMSTPSITSSTAASTTLYVGSPALYCRTSTTYCTVANMQCITACDWKWNFKVYLLDPYSTIMSKENDILYDIMQNGL